MTSQSCWQRTCQAAAYQQKPNSSLTEVNRSSELHSKLIEKALLLQNAATSTPDKPQRPESWYEDPEFPPTQSSLFVKKKLFAFPSFLQMGNGLRKAKYWLRPSDINFKNDEHCAAAHTPFNSSSSSSTDLSCPLPISLFSNSSSKDVLQGGLGSCWLIAVLCLIAERPELLFRILISTQYNPAGLHQIRLCKRGEWKIVTIDGKYLFAYSFKTKIETLRLALKLQNKKILNEEKFFLKAIQIIL